MTYKKATVEKIRGDGCRGIIEGMVAPLRRFWPCPQSFIAFSNSFIYDSFDSLDFSPNFFTILKICGPSLMAKMEAVGQPCPL